MSINFTGQIKIIQKTAQKAVNSGVLPAADALKASLIRGGGG